MRSKLHSRNLHTRLAGVRHFGVSLREGECMENDGVEDAVSAAWSRGGQEKGHAVGVYPPEQESMCFAV